MTNEELLKHDVETMIMTLRKVSEELRRIAMLEFKSKGVDDIRAATIWNCAAFTTKWSDTLESDALEEFE